MLQQKNYNNLSSSWYINTMGYNNKTFLYLTKTRWIIARSKINPLYIPYFLLIHGSIYTLITHSDVTTLGCNSTRLQSGCWQHLTAPLLCSSVPLALSAARSLSYHNTQRRRGISKSAASSFYIAVCTFAFGS